MFRSSERVLELPAARERLDAELLAEVGAWAASHEYAADGAATPTAWLVHRGNMTSIEAARLVRNARLVHTRESTAKLLEGGDITTAHVDTMARVARHRESCFDDHEDTLLDAARALPPQSFRHVAPTLARPRRRRARDRRGGTPRPAAEPARLQDPPR
jgi:hypothetical protein